MEQLLCHLTGDFLLQPSWCALNKSKRFIPCLVHILIYTSVFLLLTTSWKALLVIGGTHFILDRYHVILKTLIWWREHLNPSFSYVPKELCQFTGYFDNIGNDIDSVKFPIINTSGEHTARLNYVSVWLYIITDNYFHLLINFLALKYL